jgi:hypothetical protein
MSSIPVLVDFTKQSNTIYLFQKFDHLCSNGLYTLERAFIEKCAWLIIFQNLQELKTKIFKKTIIENVVEVQILYGGHLNHAKKQHPPSHVKTYFGC